jgi:predicted short-subunit dehydrogenase-like oxidoreductase (DUF2520 family)
MPKEYRISFVGSGNLATRLALEFENVGHHVVEVCSRNDKNALLLAAKLYKADVKTDYDFSNSRAEIIFIAVNDDAISEVAKEIIVKEGVVLVHTSASKPLELLQFAATENTGVFYPLQTFSKNKRINFEEIPIFLEAASIQAFLVLNDLARSISKKTYQVDREKRMAVHVAAVFACNFTNYLFRVAQEILKKEDLTFDLLKPLIVETVNKSLALGPDKAQTGPAARGDLETLDSHMEYLSKSGIYSEIYKIISQDIIDKKK